MDMYFRFQKDAVVLLNAKITLRLPPNIVSLKTSLRAALALNILNCALS